MTTRALTLEQAADRLQISIRSLYELESAGKIRFSRLTPRLVRVAESEIDRLLGVGGRVERPSLLRPRKIKLVPQVNQ